MIVRRHQLGDWIFWAALAALSGAPAFAAPASQPTTHPFSGEAALREQAVIVESELADLLQKRGVPSDLRGPLLEMQIDLRVMARWAFARAAGAPADGDVQAALFLRGVSFLETGEQLGKALQQAAGPLTDAQTEGLKQFHDLTFKLPKGENVAEVDELCRAGGNLLIGVAGPVSNGIKTVPPMRPMAQASASTQEAPQQPDLVDLAARAEKVKVGSSLHLQLNALAVAAADPQPKEAGGELLDTLSRSVQLAEELSSNVAVDASSRVKLEGEMAAGLALYIDPRTRDAAAARLENVARYGAVVRRINRMKITPSLRASLAPVFTWAQKNPDKGGRLFETVENYLLLCDHFDAQKTSASTTSGSARKIVDGLTKEFLADRSGFIDDTALFLGNDGVSIAPEQMAQHVEHMKRAMAAIDADERLPRAIQALNKFRPRPTGGLEKRAVAEMNTAATAQAASARDAANQFIDSVESLAAQAGSLTGEAPSVPAEVARSYGGGKLAAFEARRAEMVTDLASQLATGKEIDKAKLARFQATAAIEQAVITASVAENTLARAELLHRWVDWSINPDRLRKLLATYRSSTSATVTAIAQGDESTLSSWIATRHRYAPLLALLARDGQYLNACGELPGGAMTEPAKLATPMDGQPFGPERRASLALWFYKRCVDAGNQKSADELFDALSDRLRAELHVAD